MAHTICGWVLNLFLKQETKYKDVATGTTENVVFAGLLRVALEVKDNMRTRFQML